MKLKVIKPFDWAHDHVRVESYGKGQTIDTEDADLIRVATEEGWVKPTRSNPSAPSMTEQEVDELHESDLGDTPADDTPAAD